MWKTNFMALQKDKNIISYSSLEEMETDHYREMARMDPVEGLRSTVELILRAYGTSREALLLRPRDNVITIISRP